MLLAKTNNIYHWEWQLASDLIVVIVSLLDLWLAGSEMWAHKADTGGVEEHADSHTPFIPRGATHSGFDCVYSNISIKKKRRIPIITELHYFFCATRQQSTTPTNMVTSEGLQSQEKTDFKVLYKM